MADLKNAYGIPFKVYEEDRETLVAIDQGLLDIEEGRIVSNEDVRKLVNEWTAAVRPRKTGKKAVPKE
jgi:hypothetical protein